MLVKNDILSRKIIESLFSFPHICFSSCTPSLGQQHRYLSISATTYFFLLHCHMHCPPFLTPYRQILSVGFSCEISLWSIWICFLFFMYLDILILNVIIVNQIFLNVSYLTNYFYPSVTSLSILSTITKWSKQSAHFHHDIAFL